MPSEVIFKIDTQSIERLALRLVGTGKTVRVALARAVNHTGDKARTQVVRALVKQTGAKYGVIRKALKTKRANAATITFQIIGRGGFMSLKEFGARQTSKGAQCGALEQAARVSAYVYCAVSRRARVRTNWRFPPSGAGCRAPPDQEAVGACHPERDGQRKIKGSLRNNRRRGATKPRCP